MKTILTLIILCTLLTACGSLIIGCHAGSSPGNQYPTESKSVVPPPCVNCLKPNANNIS